MDPDSSQLIAAFESGHVWTIVLLVLLLFVSAFFSATETAYTSCNRIRLRSLESEGKKAAGKVLKQLENYDKVLTAVLIGNNIVNIAATSISTSLFIAILSGNTDVATGISTIVMTIAVLIFGEVTPKALAKDHAEKVAMAVCDILTFFYIIFYPLTFMLTLVKKIFKTGKSVTYTEDEIITIVEEAENEGELDAHESELIRSAIEFDDVDVHDIMLPRVSVEAVDETDSMDSIAKIFQEKGYSRLPVYHESIDNVIGIIHIKDFYELYKENKTDIRPIIQNSICVTETMKISAVLRLLQKEKIHMAIVVDEFGGTSGIVTLEDILEELVGEIYDEHDEIEELIKRIDETTYIVSGSENLAKMFETVGGKELDEEDFSSSTVGGWVTEELNHIPLKGETFNYENLHVEILGASNKQVEEIKVIVANDSENDDDNDD